MTRWIEPTLEQVSPELLAAVGGHPLVARLLARRGYADPHEAQAFLDPRLYHPASPYDLPGMADLVRALRAAIAEGSSIRIWGDLDADGQTATAVLFEMLTVLGASVDYRLPRHNQGHGLPMSAVHNALADGMDVLLTCDTGVTDVESIGWATDHGLTVLVTDHHDVPQELPPAAMIVDSKMVSSEHPMATLAGVGVAYQVARALLDAPEHTDVLDAMLDLVALGLIVDMVAQRGDVRYLIQRGVERMRHAPRVGLAALAEVARVDMRHIGERHIQFQIGPRVNAAGRLGDAQEFVELLVTQDRDRALVLAGQLESLNQDRRARTEALRGQLHDELARNSEALREPAIVLQGEGWPEGVLGSAAGEIARTYGKPAILIAHHENGTSTASARSVDGVDIHRAIASQADKLVRQGGHPMAAGFAAERAVIEQVIQGIQADLGAQTMPEVEDVLRLDVELDWASISMAMAEQLSRLRPFGSGNAQPVLLLRQAKLERAEPLGRLGHESAHRRLHLSDGGELRQAIVWFRAGELPQPGEWIDIAFHLDVGNWRGSPRLDVQLVDWRPAASSSEARAVRSETFEILDWRQREPSVSLIDEIENRFGDGVWLWAEGQSRPEQARSRKEWGAKPCIACALARPPSSPAILSEVLDQASPQFVVLFPNAGEPSPHVKEVLALAAGLARAAVSRYGGVLDYARAEQAVGLPDHVLRAAVEVLVARGLYGRAGDRLAIGDSNRPFAASTADQDPLMARLAHLVREVSAYRRAYATLDAAVLLATDPQ